MSLKENLQFVAPSSFVQPSFWNKLSELKINIDRLSENEREIYGFFSNTIWTTHVLEVDSTSFNSCFNHQNNAVPFHGKIFNKNTIEQFKDLDKTKLINDEAGKFLEGLKSGQILETPSKLNFFFILSFSDLKKFHFYYWFAFPVPNNVQLTVEDLSTVQQEFSPNQITTISDEYLKLDPHQKAYFLLHNSKIHTLNSKISTINVDNFREFYFGFSDFINERRNPKTQLKNFILLILHHCPFLHEKTLNFLLISLNKKQSCEDSLIYKISLPKKENQEYNWVGWEKNEKNKFSPRFSNMKATMDPEVLYEESVDLNLKLMKWRLLPDINLEKIKHAKCLLLGSGTLGCSVARNLLGWGVRNVTFVDNSTVSYSNPVRQHLFTYEDALQAKSKSQAASDALKKIFPAINSQAFQFTIPMPGHTVGSTDLETVKKSVKDLQKLIEEHEIIFLLTDSRESRWLPTLLGVYYKKIIINVALGFDSYLIMRYGNTDVAVGEKPSCTKHRIEGSNLGCYFCNDVTAPGNSLKDRSLDQQCTVTRPGVSSIAGALAVELAVSILQHKDGISAPAFYSTKDDDGDFEMGILGLLPHSIRGFLSSFSQVLPATPKYKQCIACSDIVLNEFKENGFEILLKAFNSSQYLENLTGLTALLDEANYIDVVEIGDEDDWES